MWMLGIFSASKKLIERTRISTLVIILVVFFVSGYAYYSFKNRIENPEPVPLGTIESVPSPTPPTKSEPTVEILSEAKLNVPFTAQAPTANWDELHNEACEEASAIMAAQYFYPTNSAASPNNPLQLLPSFVEQEIAKITEWFDNQYGYHLSTTTPETARMIESVYNLKTALINEFTEDDIKQALSENKLVIMPANGRLLGNPNFTPPGPIYHMLVITGYDEAGFITNDPGTRRGHNYRYSFETLYGAAAEWDPLSHGTDTTIKNIIIVEK